MTDAEFNEAIRRIRRQHLLHYVLQALVMGGAVLAVGRHAAAGTAVNPQLATWPALLLVGALLPLVGLGLYAVSRSMRPNLRRPYEENLRIYRSLVLLRDSLVVLSALPLLGSYVVTHHATDLALGGGLLLILGWQTTPSVKTYRRWLLG